MLYGSLKRAVDRGVTIGDVGSEGGRPPAVRLDTSGYLYTRIASINEIFNYFTVRA